MAVFLPVGVSCRLVIISSQVRRLVVRLFRVRDVMRDVIARRQGNGVGGAQITWYVR